MNILSSAISSFLVVRNSPRAAPSLWERLQNGKGLQIHQLRILLEILYIGVACGCPQEHTNLSYCLIFFRKIRLHGCSIASEKSLQGISASGFLVMRKQESLRITVNRQLIKGQRASHRSLGGEFWRHSHGTQQQRSVRQWSSAGPFNNGQNSMYERRWELK